MNKINPNSIYIQKSPDEVLRGYWLKKQKENHRFSIRAWAKHLGFKTHSHLHQMIHGKRLIPKKYVSVLCDNMGLNLEESQYFNLLVDLQRSKSEEEKIFFLKKLKDLRGNDSLDFRIIDEFQMLSNPLHFLLLEILSLSSEPQPVIKLKNRLRFNYSLLEIREAIEVLQKLNIITKDENNHFSRTSEHFYTKNDIPNKSIQLFHQNCSKLAQIAVQEQEQEIREFNGTTFNIKRERINEAKIAIREFREEFIRKYSSDQYQGDQTYHLNMNFFAVTKDPS